MSEQLALFHANAVEPASLAPLPAGVEELTLPAWLRLGAMSWTYPGWIGLLYAQGLKERQLLARGLTAYAQHPLLRAVELDRTFYDPLPAYTYAKFAAQVPDHFRFTAKAHQDCTQVVFPNHPRYGARAGQRNPRLLDVTYATDTVIGPFREGLGKNAGVLLFQFSPFNVRSPERFADRLYDFLRRLPQDVTYAVELRNPELLTKAYGAALAAANGLHCHNAWGRMPNILEQAARLPAETRRVLMVRWLNRPGDTHTAAEERFHPFNALREEDVATREDVATLTSQASGDAFVLVSNHAEGCAPESLFRLAQALRPLRLDQAERREAHSSRSHD